MMSSQSGTVNKKLGRVLPHMAQVAQHRVTLASLESVWDVLNLLGQLSGTTTEMGDTKTAFAALTDSLLSSLAQTTLTKRVKEMSAKAQVAIDILVRNLFERTADIGFLAIDDALRQYAAAAAAGAGDAWEGDAAPDAAAMVARLQAYVAKYSVYRDVILLAPDGSVLARLGAGMATGANANAVPGANANVNAMPGAAVTRDALLALALRSDAAYLESYARSDLFPGEAAVLLYASRVVDANARPLAVLYLCFDFDNEMQRIFTGLSRRGDYSVITLLDGAGRVIASSDPYQVAVGAVFTLPPGDGQVLRFAGRSYLATRRAAAGFQGYLGPGWSALVLVPLELAFVDAEDDAEDDDVDEDAAGALHHGAGHGAAGQDGAGAALVRNVLASGSAFAPALRAIPQQAASIQRELNRSVWNANIRQGQATQAALNPAFSKVLLAEIVRTGTRMRDVFTRSIGKLQTMVVAAELDDCRFMAALAADILDRNLYERANDCRWWALDPVLGALLAQHGAAPAAALQAQMAQRLAAINDLYTVYDSLLLFDAAGTVVACSRPALAGHVGSVLQQPWRQAALALQDPERYVVSDFVADPLYADRPTYIYATALRAPAGASAGARPLGGIAIVFDSAPQIAAMLSAAVPQSAGAFALFVDAGGQVIGSTDARWPAGCRFALPDAMLTERASGAVARLTVLDGEVMALGVVPSTGYREYAGTTGQGGQVALALVGVPLAAHDPTVGAGAAPELAAPAHATPAAGAGQGGRDGAATLEVASFQVGAYLLGVPAAAVVEAIPFGGFVRLPNRSSKVYAACIYRGATMLVYDLHAALGVVPQVPREDMLTVILVDAGGRHFGLQVDRLGDIALVAGADIAPIAEVFVGVAPLLASIVRSRQARPGPMLTLLDVEQIGAMLRDQA